MNINSIKNILSNVSTNNKESSLVGRLLTEKEVDIVAGAPGTGSCGGSDPSHTMTGGGSYTQSGNGSYDQDGGTYDMTCSQN